MFPRLSGILTQNTAGMSVIVDHPGQVELYEKLVARFPDVKRKGKNNPYTSLNGHMFTFLGKEGKLALRMAKADRDAFIEKYDSQQPVAYNTVMKEYAEVPYDMLADTDLLEGYFQTSYDYVASLKPKPTTKKKK